MEFAFKTDVGRMRELNEDSLFVENYENFTLGIIADGMGGHNAGEIASMYAVNGIKEAVSCEDMAEDTEEKLLSAFAKVNKDIYKKAVTTRGLIGMGTTLTAAVILNNKISVAHVGDTRAYIFSGDNVKQITNDHSYVEELKRMGRITEEEAKTHPGRNQLTRAVGTEDSVRIDVFTEEIKKGDIILLTSDGLTNMLDDERIAEILKESPGLSHAVEDMIYEANENGGPDNISVIALKV